MFLSQNYQELFDFLCELADDKFVVADDAVAARAIPHGRRLV